MEDLEIAMRKRKLPRRYAHDLMRRTRSHLFSKSFGWKQFLSLMEQKEPTILRAYTSLCLSKSGTLQKSEIVASLKNAGLPANEDNAVAMMRFLNADAEEFISYGHFRNFLLLLPSHRLQEDPRYDCLFFRVILHYPYLKVKVCTAQIIFCRRGKGLQKLISMIFN